PETNIRYGTAYLHILLNRYFGGVRDLMSREYCVVAAYNMGPNRFLRLYGKSNEEAIENINAMSAEVLYADLTRHLPLRETRYYVAKVRRVKEVFAELNQP
ncbi:MAG: transglycosylase SLT domain-containing protein, partial [Desulfovibrio sp.]|nr:transglycosylase SLT domain-containing protein [Desulfovibrio sp.]